MASVVILISVLLVFVNIGYYQAVGDIAAVADAPTSIKSLDTTFNSIERLKSALAGILNTTSYEQDTTDTSQAVSSQRIEKDYSVLVHANKSYIFVEDKNGNVISRRPAGTDDATAIRESINIIDRGTILFIGTFKIRSRIDNLKSGIHLKGLPGQTVFDCSEMKTIVFPCGCDDSGYSSVTTSLAEDALKGSRSVKVTDSSHYDEGDFVKLVDNESIEGFKKGEIQRIPKINGSDINFEEALNDDYTVKDDANIRELNVIKDVTIEGISFIGPGIETDVILISFSLHRNFRFTNNEVTSWGRAAIYLSDSIDCVIDNNIFENIYMTGFGYAVAITNACNDICIRDNAFRVKGRHYITAGAGTGSRNSGGFARNIKVENNTFEGCLQEAINTHAPFVGPIEIRDNTFKLCGKGIEIVNGNTVIVDNIFIKCPIGIQLLGDERRAHEIHSNEFDGNRVKMIIETKNITVYGNICDGKFRVDKDEIEFL